MLEKLAMVISQKANKEMKLKYEGIERKYELIITDEIALEVFDISQGNRRPVYVGDISLELTKNNSVLIIKGESLDLDVSDEYDDVFGKKLSEIIVLAVKELFERREIEEVFIQVELNQGDMACEVNLPGCISSSLHNKEDYSYEICEEAKINKVISAMEELVDANEVYFEKESPSNLEFEPTKYYCFSKDDVVFGLDIDVVNKKVNLYAKFGKEEYRVESEIENFDLQKAITDGFKEFKLVNLFSEAKPKRFIQNILSAAIRAEVELAYEVYGEVLEVLKALKQQGEKNTAMTAHNIKMEYDGTKDLTFEEGMNMVYIASIRGKKLKIHVNLFYEVQKVELI